MLVAVCHRRWYTRYCSLVSGLSNMALVGPPKCSRPRATVARSGPGMHLQCADRRPFYRSELQRALKMSVSSITSQISAQQLRQSLIASRMLGARTHGPIGLILPSSTRQRAVKRPSQLERQRAVFGPSQFHDPKPASLQGGRTASYHPPSVPRSAAAVLSRLRDAERLLSPGPTRRRACMARHLPCREQPPGREVDHCHGPMGASSQGRGQMGALLEDTCPRTRYSFQLRRLMRRRKGESNRILASCLHFPPRPCTGRGPHPPASLRSCVYRPQPFAVASHKTALREVAFPGSHVRIRNPHRTRSCCENVGRPSRSSPFRTPAVPFPPFREAWEFGYICLYIPCPAACTPPCSPV